MKKKLFYIISFFIIALIILAGIFYIKKNNKKVNLISKLDDEFVINKVKFYSTANAISNTTSYQNPEWNLKVYQYTDVAIYVDRLNKNISEKNYITSLEISNITQINPEKEEIYYLNPELFGKNTLDFDTKIENTLEYNVINSENKDNDQKYDIPIYFQDCSNPITIRYVKYLSNNYKVPSDKTLKYNGSLIRNLGLKIDDLNKNLKFEIKFITKDEEERKQEINLEIPYENESKSILDGDFEETTKLNIRILNKK